MNSQQLLPAPDSGMKVDDLYYIVFRHKWKILSCALAGALTSTALYFFAPPPYQSEALLFIRYVTEGNTLGVPGGDSKAVSTDQRGETIINTEVQIITSLDVAEQVADSVGPEKILAKMKGVKDRDAAAAQIERNLTAEPSPLSSVILVTYKNPDLTVVQPVLTAIIDAYLKKHVEVHRGSATSGDFLSQETDQLRTRLAQTEDDLRKARDKAGIISIDDAKKTNAEQMALIQQQIFSAEAELAERTAMLDEVSKSSPDAARLAAKAATANSGAAIPEAQLDAYRNVRVRLDWLEKTEQELLAQFTDQNQRVKEVRAQIAEAEAQRQKFEEKYPDLARIGAPPAPAANSAAGVEAGAIDPQAEAARLAGLQSKIKVLNDELAQIRAQAADVSQAEGSISELQRQKELEDTNYRYFLTHLEASRIDDQLNAGHALNIAEIQQPTPPSINWAKTYKILGGIVAGGFAVGLAWAFMIESYFDRTIRRPADVEKGLQVPLFLSIPDFGRDGHHRNVFHETLRDRLISYFESRNLTHKPKLVAVTGVGRNSGVTTTAAGLAHSLSETGAGNVLLVDMTVSQGSAQQFYKGKAVCGLDQLLDTRDTAQVQEKLYVVGAEPDGSDKLSRALPMRFNQLVPKLKAGDFDYIIFDMPPVNQISITPRLAGFMDMVLLVVESEHTDRDLARQAATLLAASQAHVGAVMNKTRNYLPSKAHHDFLGSD
jgi:polysaccharide biosynthesis transport protein